MAKAIIESRTKGGVEVYDVGKAQLWEWAHWAAAGAGNAQKWTSPKTVAVCADSLAKGTYLVMELQFCGRIQDAAYIVCIQDADYVMTVSAKASARSLKEAVELAGLYKIDGPYPTCHGDYINDVSNIIEVWHVVDDADLWQEWEYGVAKSHIAQGWDTNYHLFENQRCVLDCANLPKVVYCIQTTCADGETVITVDYYATAESLYKALDLACGLPEDLQYEFVHMQDYYANELGITVVNDDSLDEGLADTLPVVVFYLRLPDVEDTASITK